MTLGLHRSRIWGNNEKRDNDKVQDDKNSTKMNGTVNFGKCSPDMSFKFGRLNRKSSEGTYFPIDELIAQGQKDSFEPSTIMIIICDRLLKVCEADNAAIEKCERVKKTMIKMGPEGKSTADAWNEAFNN